MNILGLISQLIGIKTLRLTDGIHEAFQASNPIPLLTLQHIPFDKVFLELRINCQA